MGEFRGRFEWYKFKNNIIRVVFIFIKKKYDITSNRNIFLKCQKAVIKNITEGLIFDIRICMCYILCRDLINLIGFIYFEQKKNKVKI